MPKYTEPDSVVDGKWCKPHSFNVIWSKQVSYAVGKYLYDFHTMSLSFLWKWKCRWRYLKYGLVSRPDFLVMWSTSWYRNHSSIIQKLRSRNDSCAALTMETWIISPWLSWAGAYVPSLFQRLLNHTSISGEGPNWRNVLFKFNVCCR